MSYQDVLGPLLGRHPVLSPIANMLPRRYEGGTDSVPAMLSPGEGVLNTGAMQMPGVKAAVDRLNAAGRGASPMKKDPNIGTGKVRWDPVTGRWMWQQPPPRAYQGGTGNVLPPGYDPTVYPSPPPSGIPAGYYLDANGNFQKLSNIGEGYGAFPNQGAQVPNTGVVPTPIPGNNNQYYFDPYYADNWIGGLNPYVADAPSIEILGGGPSSGSNVTPQTPATPDPTSQKGFDVTMGPLFDKAQSWSQPYTGPGSYAGSLYQATTPGTTLANTYGSWGPQTGTGGLSASPFFAALGQNIGIGVGLGSGEPREGIAGGVIGNKNR